MFRRFDPDKDVSTSTPIKASVQRSIKVQILNAHPLLRTPATSSSSNSTNAKEPIEAETETKFLDEVLPKKTPLIQYKIHPQILLYCRPINEDQEYKGINYPCFYQSRHGPILPTLKFVHAHPQLKFKQVTVDKGAIPFVLGGANIMCPGLTNSGGYMPLDREDCDGEHVDNEKVSGEGLKKGEGVVVYAEGKKYALAVGVMKIGSRQIRSKNKGVGIEVMHYIGDGLYHVDEIS